MVEPPKAPAGPSRLGLKPLTESSTLRSAGILPAPTHAPPTKTSIVANLKPGNWRHYWNARQDIEVKGRGTFRVHTGGTEGPVLLCIHGGGYAGQTWSLVAGKLKDKGLRIFAPDLRGHGETKCGEIDSKKLDRDTLVEDIVEVWKASAWAAENPPVVLVGHSLGGALVVYAAPGIPNCAGVIVVDVVEGTALASLPHMMSVVTQRPDGFPTLNAAIQWSLKTGMCHNPEAACISVPSMLDLVIALGTPICSLMPAGTASPRRGTSPAPLPSLAEDEEEGEEEEAKATKDEEEGEGEEQKEEAKATAKDLGNTSPTSPVPSTKRFSFEPMRRPASLDLPRGRQRSRPGLPPPSPTPPAPPPSATGKGQWRWRTPLAQSFQYWEGWFEGMSQAFLDLKVPKVLVLAGADRLDKTLMIGQMQGKFQLVLLPQAGHAVHEEEAERMSEVVTDFVERFRVGQTIEGIPKPAAGSKPVLPIVAGPSVATAPA